MLSAMATGNFIIMVKILQIFEIYSRIKAFVGICCSLLEANFVIIADTQSLQSLYKPS